jgi:hypothetical protein
MSITQSKHWRWMPGMVNTDNERVIDTSVGLRLSACGGLARDQITDVDDPNLEDPATQGCLEHGLLPEAWASVGGGRRVTVEVIHTHRLDPDADRLEPAYVCRVLVFCDTWREAWASEKCSSRGEALAACLEAAP